MASAAIRNALAAAQGVTDAAEKLDTDAAEEEDATEEAHQAEASARTDAPTVEVKTAEAPKAEAAPVRAPTAEAAPAEAPKEELAPALAAAQARLTKRRRWIDNFKKTPDYRAYGFSGGRAQRTRPSQSRRSQIPMNRTFPNGSGIGRPWPGRP